MKGEQKKIYSIGQIKKMVARAKKAGQTVVTTNGCFDILHIGHVRYLNYAREHGDMLIVGVNSDSSVRSNKGAARPIVPERERAEVVAALRSVDAVFIFSDKTPEKWLRVLKPHIHVKGADRTLSEILEKKVVESGGGKIVRAPYQKSHSTTHLISKIRAH